MPLQILPRPTLPDGLADAATLGALVPFIGAGVSRLAGCPSWVEFADSALDELVKKKAISAAQRSQMASLSPRVKLSVAQLAAKEKGEFIDFRSIIHRKPDWRSSSDGRRVYGSISALSKRFITTNYDEWLDIVMPPLDIQATGDAISGTTPIINRRVLHQPQDLTPSSFAVEDVVAHLHGTVLDVPGMVLTTSDYISRYAVDRHRQGGDGENPVLTFLEHVFRNKTILFIGYGLEELEILEYIILKGKVHRGAGEAGHYALQGFFSFETALCDAMESYLFNECGVQLIPFLRDENDWMQLTVVLDHWANSLPASDAATVQELLEMKGFLDE